MRSWNFLTPFGVVLGILYLNLAHCRVARAMPLAAPAYFECERVLKILSHSQEQQEVFELLDRLERLNLSDHGEIQRTLEQMTDLALEGRELESIRKFAQHLLSQLIQEQSARAPASLPRPSLAELELNDIKANTLYLHPRPEIKGVIFDQMALDDLADLSMDTRARLRRGLLKGFVPPLSGPGIVRATDVHPQFFEVKAAHSVERLLGCLDNGILHIKRGYYKRNGGRGGALQSYAYLCHD